MGWSMPRWKELPDSLDPRVRQLIVQLRRLKDRSGLSLVSLQDKTGFSRSSWERYLNGRKLPPRAAVQELARVCGAEPTPLLVLHEVAESAWRQNVPPGREGPRGQESEEQRKPEEQQGPEVRGTAPESAPPSPAGSVPAPRPAPTRRGWPRRPIVLAGALLIALIALGAGLVVLNPWWDDSTSTATSRTNGAAAGSWAPGKTYSCKVRRVHGRLTAGYSQSDNGEYQESAHGWPVVEAQCLLTARGFSPGGVDGVFGPATESAVKRFQSKHRQDPGPDQPPLAVDGIIGPHTWGVLRK